jgi:hypothetical protein
MNPIEHLIERKFSNLQTGAAVVLPGGRRLGAADASVTLTLKELSPPPPRAPPVRGGERC